MTDFTYEATDRAEKLEKYEWDNVWWEQADTDKENRVLYIGDSISCPTRTIATKMSDGKWLFDGFGTSKALDNPFFYDSLRLFAKQQGVRKAIVFNNGLHGWHLSDGQDYPEYYEKMINFLISEFPEIKLLLALTTHVANKERNERVIKRNQKVTELAKKYGLKTVDLYALTEDKEALLTDGVHFSKEGYELIATEILKALD